MPTVFLTDRATDLVELMDDPDCDLRRLRRTYDQFETLNRLLAGWGRIYRRRLRPVLSRPGARVLDIGCGGGDVLRHLADQAERDGLKVSFTGIDPDERAIEFARSRTGRPEIELRRCTSGDLRAESRRYDVVLSNHVLHHLEPPELRRVLDDSVALCRGLCVHNDIRRDDAAPVLFQWTRLVFRDSFVVEDGQRSIRRAYTAGELRSAVGEGWSVSRLFPFRLLAERRSR